MSNIDEARRLVAGDDRRYFESTERGFIATRKDPIIKRPDGRAAADMSGTVKIDMPAETARLKSGPEVDTARQACMTCHSVDYIYMQPPLTKDQWRGEVVKMKNVFGAPFPESDVEAIVTYLMSQNGTR